MIHFKRIFQKLREALPPSLRECCERLKLRIKFPESSDPSDAQIEDETGNITNENVQTRHGTSEEKELGITLYVDVVPTPPGILKMRHYLTKYSLLEDVS